MNSRYIWVIVPAFSSAFNLFGIVYDLHTHSYGWAACMAGLLVISSICTVQAIRDLKP